MPDMTMKQIEDQINARFRQGHRLVFWYDGKGEFSEEVMNLTFPGVSLYRLKPGWSFHDKRVLTRDRASERFLVYAPFPKPPVHENHLEDVYLYSAHFSASRMTLLAENGQIPENVAESLAGYVSFFQSKERMDKFLSVTRDVTKWTVKKAKLAMMAVLAKGHMPLAEPILQAVIQREALQIEKGAEGANPILQDFEKFGLLPDFWEMSEEELGISGEGLTARRLVLSIFVSAAAGVMGEGALPKSWAALAVGRPQSSIVFLDHMKTDRNVFDILSRYASRELSVSDALSRMDPALLISLDLFSEVDACLIQWLAGRLRSEDLSAKLSGLSLEDLCQARKETYFHTLYAAAYEMLAAAVKVLSAVSYVPPSGSMKDVADQYIHSDFQWDRAYRLWCLAMSKLTDPARAALARDGEALSDLVDRIYTHCYLDPCILNWNDHMGDPTVSSFVSQRRFFAHYVAGRSERTVVIISDALRYEVGVDVMESLSMNRLYKTKMETMLGLVPSYTRLGMAALLPHRELSIAEDGSGLVDGEICNSLERREWKLKQAVKSAKAVQADDLRQMKRADLRAFCKGVHVLYVYHDQIDTRGENSPDEVCQAAKEAVDEIVGLVRQLNTDGYFQRFLITADHGFIYRRKAAQEDEKIGNVSGAGRIVKRRYIIGDHPVTGHGIESLPLSITLGTQDERYVSFPVSSCVFKAPGSGGRNYVHGGSSPQECLLPVILLQALRGRMDEKPAQIQLLTTSQEVHSLSPVWNFIQQERVGNGIVPAVYKVRMIDENGIVISDEPVVRADSASSDMNDRLFRITLHLKAQVYDSWKEYTLQILSGETGMEVSHFSVRIDIPM